MKIIDILQSPSYTSKNVLEKLICYKLGVTKETLFTDSDREISSSDFERIESSYHDYHVGKKPLEYILGFVEFLGVRFHVDSATLIPRPETEYMIEAVGEMLQDMSQVPSNQAVKQEGTKQMGDKQSGDEHADDKQARDNNTKATIIDV